MSDDTSRLSGMATVTLWRFGARTIGNDDCTKW